MDSTALLHATAAAAASLGVHVIAMHVHHGLSAHADAWAAQARQLCERWARRGRPVTFDLRRLTGRPMPGESIEAWARRGRYAALRDMAGAAGTDLVLLAHHRRDQAETFLLQALRAAGVNGLAAMPRAATRDGVAWARPWLGVPRAAIAAYARSHRLVYVEDDSNDDRRYARNRLRLDVWPALEAAFPDAETALATAARLAGDARAVLDETTDADLQTVSATGGGLDLGTWRRLSAARRRLTLLAWLRGCIDGPPPRTLVDRLIVELDRPQAMRWPAPDGTLRRRGQILTYQPASGAVPR